MACNASNHPSNCNCGWGGYGHIGRGSLYGSTPSVEKWITSSYTPVYNWEFDYINKITDYYSFTNPNASCPVCREQVFFYQSPDGGRVFFDSLGPPWPKHPCTDNTSKPSSIPENDLINIETSWQEYNWLPAIVESVKKRNNLWNVSLSERGQIFVTLTDISYLKAGMPMQIREIIGDFYQLSFFDPSFNQQHCIGKLLYYASQVFDVDKLRIFTIMEYKQRDYRQGIPRIPEAYYEKIVEDPSLPLEYCIYIFFRFIQSKQIFNNLIKNEIVIESGLIDFFKDVRQRGERNYFLKYEKGEMKLPENIIHAIKKTKNIPILYDFVNYISGRKKWIIEPKKKKNI